MTYRIATQEGMLGEKVLCKSEVLEEGGEWEIGKERKGECSISTVQ